MSKRRVVYEGLPKSAFQVIREYLKSLEGDDSDIAPELIALRESVHDEGVTWTEAKIKESFTAFSAVLSTLRKE